MTLFSIIASILCAAAIYTAEPINDISPSETKTTTETTRESVPAAITEAFSQSSDKIKLSWEETEDAEEYGIFRSLQPEGEYEQIAKTDKTIVSYVDCGLTAGNTYYYKIGVLKTEEGYALSEPSEVFLLEKCDSISVCSSGSTALDISWKQMPGAENYLLYRKNRDTGKYEQIAEIPSGGTDTYHDTGLTAGITYYYKIKATAMQNGHIGSSSLSSPISGIPVGKTTISRISSKNGTLQISWKKVKGVYRYQVYRSTTQNGIYEKIASIKKDHNTYTDKNVKAGKKYYYKIRTVNLHNGSTGLGSDSKPAYGISVDKPKMRYVRSLSSTRLQIKWQITAGADSYRIYRSSSKNGTYKKIAVIGNRNKTTYTDKKLSPNQTYFYRIQAFNNINNRNGYGKQSAKASGKTLSKTNLYSVKRISKQKWKLKWKKVSGADGYEIARATKKKGKFQVIKQVASGKTLSYTDKTSKPGKRYYYKIRAIHTDGNVTGYGNYSKAVTDGSIMLDTDWKITQYGDNNGKQSMFYTIQDTKGHLIVIDGGWLENADMVKKTIASQGGHVDAWFLTHPHEDHIGAFCTIYETPGNISIDNIYAVEMASPELCLANAPWDSVEAYQKFRSLNIPQLKYVHSGDIIKVKKLKIEILSAYEKKIDDISSDLLNDGSMLFKVYGREESMLFCADMGKSASDYIKKKYGNKLKSEYLQMGHHGNGGLKKDFYKLVNPNVAFFDAPAWLMENWSGNYTTPENRKYMENMGSSVVSFSTAPNTIILK